MDALALALKKAPEYVATLYQSRLSTKYVFHTYDRTVRTVELCTEIAAGSGLKKGEQEIALLATWFKDTGHTDAEHSPHQQSIRIVTGFLQEHGVAQQVIDAVSACITAAARTDPPKNLTEQVVCDADLAFLGKKKTLRWLDLLRVERENILGTPLSDPEWLPWAVRLFTENPFFTSYAQSSFQKQREQNLIALQAQLRETVNRKEDRTAKEEAKIEKERRPERGIETMFRTVPRNHLDLSSIADHKANILISVNALVISIVLLHLLRTLDEIQHLIVPTLILIVVCVLTIVFATLATKPKVTTGTFAREDIQKKKANLLFFGNFYKMPYEDFEWGLKEMMKDREYLYGTMIRDFFNLGQVLGRKYFYLRIAYNVFMYGMILAVLAYAIAMLR